jgi:hypothetical protein
LELLANISNNTKNLEQDLLNKRFSFENFSSNKKIHILLRNTIPEIPNTTYGTFGIYKYPAKFIPQVIAFVLKEYGKTGMIVFDPFAGYGTVGIVSKVYGLNYELWDLNPITEVIHKIATYKYNRLENITKIIKEIRNSNETFIPQWSNLSYWFPEEFLEVLTRAWGFVKALDEQSQLVMTIPLLKTTRFFSYSDEKVHKLYKSKHSRKKINELVKKDWTLQFYSMLEKETEIILRKIKEYEKLNPREVDFKIFAGVDSLKKNLDRNVNILITSPPYLQAQEYIRSTKLELYWLGYKESLIRELSCKELPYRKVEPINVCSEKYYHYRDIIKEQHLKSLFERYFWSIIKVFNNVQERVLDYMCIFVGPAKIRNVSIPLDDIIIEHLSTLGWEHEITYVDKIVSRVMFRSNINPASGEKDSRIENEYLIILKRR